jgi:hypothetical protein
VAGGRGGNGHAGNTVYFSDRPQRLTGDAPTAHVFDLVFGGKTAAPNAALVADLPWQHDAVFILELTHPQTDATTQTLTYDASLLPTYQGEHLQPPAAKQAARPVAPRTGVTFGTASLFIDAAVVGDCPDMTVHCCGGVYCDPLGHQHEVSTIRVGTCIKSLCSSPCRGWDAVQTSCNQTFPAACQAADRGYCEAACCGCPNCS